MHLELVYKICSCQSILGGGKSCYPGRFAPEKLQFLLGVGGEVVCTLLTWIADT